MPKRALVATRQPSVGSTFRTVCRSSLSTTTTRDSIASPHRSRCAKTKNGYFIMSKGVIPNTCSNHNKIAKISLGRSLRETLNPPRNVQKDFLQEALKRKKGLRFVGYGSGAEIQSRRHYAREARDRPKVYAQVEAELENQSLSPKRIVSDDERMEQKIEHTSFLSDIGCLPSVKRFNSLPVTLQGSTTSYVAASTGIHHLVRQGSMDDVVNHHLRKHLKVSNPNLINVRVQHNRKTLPRERRPFQFSLTSSLATELESNSSLSLNRVRHSSWSVDGSFKSECSFTNVPLLKDATDLDGESTWSSTEVTEANFQGRLVKLSGKGIRSKSLTFPPSVLLNESVAAMDLERNISRRRLHNNCGYARSTQSSYFNVICSRLSLPSVPLTQLIEDTTGKTSAMAVEQIPHESSNQIKSCSSLVTYTPINGFSRDVEQRSISSPMRTPSLIQSDLDCCLSGSSFSSFTIPVVEVFPPSHQFCVGDPVEEFDAGPSTCHVHSSKRINIPTTVDNNRSEIDTEDASIEVASAEVDSDIQCLEFNAITTTDECQHLIGSRRDSTSSPSSAIIPQSSEHRLQTGDVSNRLLELLDSFFGIGLSDPGIRSSVVLRYSHQVRPEISRHRHHRENRRASFTWTENQVERRKASRRLFKRTKLPTVLFDATKMCLSTSEDIRCSICLEDFQHLDKQNFLPCFHTFHKRCISKWFRRSLLCPICLVDIRQLLNMAEVRRCPASSKSGSLCHRIIEADDSLVALHDSYDIATPIAVSPFSSPQGFLNNDLNSNSDMLEHISLTNGTLSRGSPFKIPQYKICPSSLTPSRIHSFSRPDLVTTTNRHPCDSVTTFRYGINHRPSPSSLQVFTATNTKRRLPTPISSQVVRLSSKGSYSDVSRSRTTEESQSYTNGELTSNNIFTRYSPIISVGNSKNTLIPIITEYNKSQSVESSRELKTRNLLSRTNASEMRFVRQMTAVPNDVTNASIQRNLRYSKDSGRIVKDSSLYCDTYATPIIVPSLVRHLPIVHHRGHRCDAMASAPQGTSTNTNQLPSSAASWPNLVDASRLTSVSSSVIGSRVKPPLYTFVSQTAHLVRDRTNSRVPGDSTPVAMSVPMNKSSKGSTPTIQTSCVFPLIRPHLHGRGPPSTHEQHSRSRTSTGVQGFLLPPTPSSQATSRGLRPIMPTRRSPRPRLGCFCASTDIQPSGN